MEYFFVHPDVRDQLLTERHLWGIYMITGLNVNHNLHGGINLCRGLGHLSNYNSGNINSKG